MSTSSNIVQFFNFVQNVQLCQIAKITKSNHNSISIVFIFTKLLNNFSVTIDDGEDLTRAWFNRRDLAARYFAICNNTGSKNVEDCGRIWTLLPSETRQVIYQPQFNIAIQRTFVYFLIGQKFNRNAI